MKYYELRYFYSRSNSGSIYISTELDFDKYYDETEFLEDLLKHNIIDNEHVDNICGVIEMDKTEFDYATGCEKADNEISNWLDGEVDDR